MVLRRQGARFDLGDCCRFSNGGKPAGVLCIGRALQLGAEGFGSGVASGSFAMTGPEPRDGSDDDEASER